VAGKTIMNGFTTMHQNGFLRGVSHELVFATSNENGYFQEREGVGSLELSLIAQISPHYAGWFG
jgi:hypothetical protein